VRFVPEKAAETEADEGQDAGQTDENQSGESEAAQTDQTSAAGTGEGETTE
jgi:cell division protein FtsQ